MPSADDLRAVTVDAAGTCLELVDPVAPLRRALTHQDVERGEEAVRRAFAAEVRYYVPRSHEGRDPASLAELRERAVGVFLAELDADVEPAAFVPLFMSTIAFVPVDGAREALTRLREAGLRLACVANWDVTLREHLERAELEDAFAAVVSSAEAGAAKPDPAPFHLALERLGVEPRHALHVGDDDADREGAAAAGLAFAWTPLVTLPQRLGLE